LKILQDGHVFIYNGIYIMIRAVYFDFYGVWTPDRLSYYLANAQIISPEAFKDMYDQVQLYYQGIVSVEQIAEYIRGKLGHPDINVNQFQLSESSISPEIVNFLRELHSHFLKVGILANLGKQEVDLLKQFNQHNQMFEAIVSPLTLNLKLPLLNREVFAKAIEGIGEQTSDCLYVSGNPYHLQFASSLGIPNLQFEGLPKLRDDLNRLITSSPA
jgi:FMN phosphatase YigB (HAD superfamily)